MKPRMIFLHGMLIFVNGCSLARIKSLSADCLAAIAKVPILLKLKRKVV